MNDLNGPLPDELHLEEAGETAIKEAQRLPDEPPVEKQEEAEPPKDEATEPNEDEPKPGPEEEPKGEGEEDGEDDDDEPKLSKSQQRRLRQREYNDRLRRENADLKQRLGVLEDKVNNPAPQADAEPKLEDFDSFEEYTEAKIDYRVKQATATVIADTKKDAQQAAQVQSNEQREAALMDKGRETHEDFDATVSVAEAYVTPAMAQALLHSEHGHELLYALGQDTDQAARIASLPPQAAALELGKMEANLSRPVPKKTTKAPQPTKKPAAADGPTEKSPDQMTQKEYEAWRSKQ